jgi:hypothetical protein
MYTEDAGLPTKKKKWKPSVEYCDVLRGMCDLWTGYRLDIGFTDHLYTPLGATLYRPLTHRNSCP